MKTGVTCLVGVLVVAALGAIIAGQLGAFTGTRPEEVRPRSIAEAGCSVGTMNCVSTADATNSYKSFPAQKFKQGSLPAHIALIKSIMEKHFGVKPSQETQDYLHFEVSTPLMKFVDDVEFFLLPGEELIHIRSASRLGKSDLDANYKRLLKIEFHYVQSQVSELP